jgi:hypothetical protein
MEHLLWRKYTSGHRSKDARKADNPEGESNPSLPFWVGKLCETHEKELQASTLGERGSALWQAWPAVLGHEELGVGQQCDGCSLGGYPDTD